MQSEANRFYRLSYACLAAPQLFRIIFALVILLYYVMIRTKKNAARNWQQRTAENCLLSGPLPPGRSAHSSSVRVGGRSPLSLFVSPPSSPKQVWLAPASTLMLRLPTSPRGFRLTLPSGEMLRISRRTRSASVSLHLTASRTATLKCSSAVTSSFPFAHAASAASTALK